MSFKTELLTVRNLIVRLIDEAKIEKINLETKLGASTVTTFKSAKSVAERDEDKVNWQAKLVRAEAELIAAASGSLEFDKAELERDDLKVKLNRVKLSERMGGSDPLDIVEGAKMIKRFQALLDIENNYIAELELRMTQLPV